MNRAEVPWAAAIALPMLLFTLGVFMVSLAWIAAKPVYLDVKPIPPKPPCVKMWLNAHANPDFYVYACF